MTDALIDLEEMLPQLPAAVVQRRIGEGLGQTIEALRDASALIERLTALFAVAALTRFDVDPAQKDLLHDLEFAAEELGGQLISAASADDLRLVRDSYRQMQLDLGRLEGQVRRHALSALQAEFRPLDVIGTLLKKIDGAAPLGQRLVTLAAQGLQPVPGETMAALYQRIQRMRRCRVALDAERQSFTEDAEVDRFIDALAAQKATLRLVTERVRKWLDQHGALDRFELRAIG
ncbi:hypothetical protein JL101_029330 (plasmid) [Skermanella rosea]|uniref:hypothetical protein n=1 Tax=Skermanella rosea TaxID=1817965 RepID=UPI0019339C93|nr:hypothetical protein [Skermanella rosea]UEM07105.1 hypothetical protein JL101_029330 [Skermanella rosea]